MKKLIPLAFLFIGSASAEITDVHYNCDGATQITVGFVSLTVNGEQFKYLGPATGTGTHENGQQYDITGSEFEDGWIFVRGDSVASGLLSHEENFWYCERKL